MNTFSLGHFFSWDPYLKITVALILISLTGGCGPAMLNNGNIISALILILVTGGFSAPMIKNGVDDISKRETASKRLDAFSLGLFRKFADTFYGIFFNLTLANLHQIEAMRRLIDLGLIELNAFPSDVPTQIYSFTKLGSFVLEKKLNRMLLPEDFCEMLRICYWRGYEKEFKIETDNFEIKYKLSWNEAWKAFEPIMLNKKDSKQTETDAFAIFLIYVMGKSYDDLNNDLVIPWQNETKKLKKWWRYIF